MALHSPSSRGELEFVRDRFKDLRRGVFHVYVSDLVLMECTWAIKRRVAERKENASSSKADVSKRIGAAVTSFYDEILRAQHAGMVTVENPGGSLDDFFRASHDLSHRHQGQTLRYREANRRYQYTGAGFLDFQHAIIATSLKCAYLYSLDRGFNTLGSMPEFSALTVTTP